MNDLEKYKILINGMNDTDDFKFKRTLIKQFIKKIYKTYDNKEHNNNEYNEIVYNIDNIIKKNFICDCYPIITNVLQRQCMCPKCNKKSNFIIREFPTTLISFLQFKCLKWESLDLKDNEH